MNLLKKLSMTKTETDPRGTGHWWTRHHRPALHLVATAADRRICLPVTVDERDVLRVRRALIQSSGGEIDVIRATHVRHTTRMRLAVEMKRLALERTMLAVIEAVDSAEFGRVAPMA